MRKKTIGIIAGVIAVGIVVAVVLATNNGVPPSNAQPPGVNQPETQISIPVTFTGDSTATTQPFTVTTDEWAIDWSYVRGSDYAESGAFGLWVFSKGESVGCEDAVIAPSATAGSISGSTGQGEYYIEVIARSVEGWEITVRPASGESTSPEEPGPEEPEESTPEEPPPPPPTFEPLTFTGSSDTKTAPFKVTTAEWIIDWSYAPEDPEFPWFALFWFYIYPRGETVYFEEYVVAGEETEGSTYSYAGPGEYYIEVTCANLASWQITIRPAP